jgi:hypothetical protein
VPILGTSASQNTKSFLNLEVEYLVIAGGGAGGGSSAAGGGGGAGGLRYFLLKLYLV